MNNKIRVARAEARMTQQQLAEAIGISVFQKTFRQIVANKACCSGHKNFFHQYVNLYLFFDINIP